MKTSEKEWAGKHSLKNYSLLQAYRKCHTRELSSSIVNARKKENFFKIYYVITHHIWQTNHKTYLKTESDAQEEDKIPVSWNQVFTILICSD